LWPGFLCNAIYSQSANIDRRMAISQRIHNVSSIRNVVHRTDFSLAQVLVSFGFLENCIEIMSIHHFVR